MRIHTRLTEFDLTSIAKTLPAYAGGVQIHALTEHGSRTHERGFELVLSGSSVFRGQYGDCDFKTATWDEWGVFLGRLFALDATARVGGLRNPVYADADDFHQITGYRYDADADPPLDKLCPRHRWTWPGAGPYSSRECNKCGARLYPKGR